MTTETETEVKKETAAKKANGAAPKTKAAASKTKAAATKTVKAAKKTAKTAKKETAKETKKLADRVEKITKDASESLNLVVEQIRDGYKEAAEVLSETNSRMSTSRREVILAIIDNARTNSEQTFETLREVIEAESTGDSIRIQRDALRESIERQLTQVREVAQLAVDGSKNSLEPVGQFIKARTGRNGEAKADA